MRRNPQGFTLIELLIVVAIIGIIVAIAIPNLLNAIQRAKQRRTMGDIRSAATATEAYAVDFSHYPAAAGYSLPTGLSFGSTTFGDTTKPSSLSAQITPTYIRVLPMVDGWQSYFFYSSTGQLYGILSAGKDGTKDSALIGGETTDFNNDIVFVNGQFVQYPAGAQR